MRALQPVIDERRHVVSLVLPWPLSVRGDPGRLRQVVSNLLENAAKYTEPGGTIIVTLEQRGDEAVLAVRDTGIGIDAENLQRIFEPFTQSHQPLTSLSSGLGIGLSVVRRIVELHGGRVTVTSCRCRGRKRVRGLAAGAGGGQWRRARTDGVSGLPPARAAALRSRRMLIVDDHEEVRISISRLARGWGHQVALAADGSSALRWRTTFSPSALSWISRCQG